MTSRDSASPNSGKSCGAVTLPLLERNRGFLYLAHPAGRPLGMQEPAHGSYVRPNPAFPVVDAASHPRRSASSFMG